MILKADKRCMIGDLDNRGCYSVKMLTRRATFLGLMGLTAFPAFAFARNSRFAPSISHRNAKGEFQRVFRLITEGDFNALQAYGPVQLVVRQKTLTEEESRAFVAEIAAEAVASGPKFFRINSFERAKGDPNRVLFYAHSHIGRASKTTVILKTAMAECHRSAPTSPATNYPSLVGTFTSKGR